MGDPFGVPSPSAAAAVVARFFTAIHELRPGVQFVLA